MREYNYTAHLVKGDETKLVTRAFSKQLTDEMLKYLDADLLKTYPDYKLIKYELQVKEIQ